MLAMVTKGRHGLALADHLAAGFLRLLLAGAIALAGSALALAATPDAPGAPGAPTEPNAQAIPSADIPARADADEQFVYSILRRTLSKDGVAHFERSIADRAAGVQELAERTNDVDLALLSVRRLESLQRHWHLFDRAITQTRAELARAVNVSSEDLAQLASRRDAWQATRLTPGLAPALLDRVDELIAQIEAAEKTVGLPLGKLLDTARKGNAL